MVHALNDAVGGSYIWTGGLGIIFECWAKPFPFLNIFENQEEINQKVLAQFSDGGDKQYSSLVANRERIAIYFQGVL